MVAGRAWGDSRWLTNGSCVLPGPRAGDSGASTPCGGKSGRYAAQLPLAPQQLVRPLPRLPRCHARASEADALEPEPTPRPQQQQQLLLVSPIHKSRLSQAPAARLLGGTAAVVAAAVVAAAEVLLPPAGVFPAAPPIAAPALRLPPA